MKRTIDKRIDESLFSAEIASRQLRSAVTTISAS
jgi:hypothetical protein